MTVAMKYVLTGIASFLAAGSAAWQLSGGAPVAEPAHGGSAATVAGRPDSVMAGRDFDEVLAELAGNPGAWNQNAASLDALLKSRPQGAQSRRARRDLVDALLKEWAARDPEAAARYVMGPTAAADAALRQTMLERGGEAAPAVMLAGLDSFPGTLACDAVAASLKHLPADLPAAQLVAIYSKCTAASLPSGGVAADLWVRHYGERNPQGLAAIAEAARDTPAGSALLTGAVDLLAKVDLPHAQALIARDCPRLIAPLRASLALAGAAPWRWEEFSKGLDALPAVIDRAQLFTQIASFSADPGRSDSDKAPLVDWARQHGGYEGATLLAGLLPTMHSVPDDQVRELLNGLPYGPQVEKAVTECIGNRGEVESWAAWIDGKQFPVSAQSLDWLAERLVLSRRAQAEAFAGNTALTGTFAGALRAKVGELLQKPRK